MTNVDTPDHQRGTVSAQKLLATVTGGADTVTVTVPPNAQTLIAIIPSAGYLTAFSCTGVASGAEYPAARLPPVKGGGAFSYVFFDVSNAVDDQVDVYQGGGTANDWYVYADAGVHITMDATVVQASEQAGEASPRIVLQVGGTDGTDLRAIRTDTNGQQFTVPVPPGTGSSDHPVSELKIVSGQSAVDTAVLPAAPAGQRYRIFSGQIGIPVNDVNAYLADSASEIAFCVAGGQGAGSVYLGPSGFPLTEGAGVSLFMTSSGNPVIYMLSYTLETV